MRDCPDLCAITSPFHHGKVQRVAHGQPLDAFSTFGTSTRHDSLLLATIEMEVMVGGFEVTGSEPQEVEQEIVDGMSGGYGVQRDHAGVGFLYTIGLSLTFAVGLRLNRKLHGIDQAVAPKAASARPDVSHRAHGVFEVAAFTLPYFCAHLYGRNEVLVGKRINDKSGPHGVGSQEDEVAIAQDLCDRMARDVAGDRLEGNVRRHFPCMANRDLGLELACFHVNSSRPNHTGEIAALDLVRVNKNEVPNAKSGEVLRY